MADAKFTLAFRAGQVFTPGAPISEQELFSGRIDQVNKIIDTISQPGYHAILYGERGVGKTSLSNVLSGFMQRVGTSFYFPRVNCDAGDTFTTLWKKLFQDITISETKSGIGFASDDVTVIRSLLEELPESLTPDDIRRSLSRLSGESFLVPIFDEFDRIGEAKTTTLMADTIKCLSDYGVGATIVVIGVADSVDELIEGHQSIERALVQIPMPRMSDDEVAQIIANGLNKLDMKIREPERRAIIDLSQGLPYVAHLLSLHATHSAIDRNSETVQREDLRNGIAKSLENWQQSIKTAYYNATKSQQPGNIFKEVVLACAFAENDDFGYFSAANVRDPLRQIIPDKEYDIPNYARHLKQLSGAERGNLLYRTGKKRGLRYRFHSPLMRPYIVMRGINDGIIAREDLRALTADRSDEDIVKRML